jgi:flagellar basal body-associated protein FliL
MVAGMAPATGVAPQPPMPSALPPTQQQPAYGTAQQTPPPYGTAEQQVQQGYGTAQTPMTWTGGAPVTDQTIAPEPRKGKGALIAIPIVLVVLLILGGGAAAALYFTGVIGPPSGKGTEDTATKVTAKTSIEKKDDGEKPAHKEDETPEKQTEPPAVEPEDEGDGKVKIKFTTTPNGADVILKIGTHHRTLCATNCTHEFNETDKTVKVILRKKGYRDQILEFSPDFNKELITKLSRVGKKKSGGTVVKEFPTPPKPKWEIKPTKPGGGKKKPIIKVIDKPKGSGTSGSGGKKPPAIKIIKSPKK